MITFSLIPFHFAEFRFYILICFGNNLGFPKPYLSHWGNTIKLVLFLLVKCVGLGSYLMMPCHGCVGTIRFITTFESGLSDAMSCILHVGHV